MATFEADLRDLINRHSKENGSDTSDIVLAQYLMGCLEVFDKAVVERERWYGRTAKRGDCRPGFVDPESDEAKRRR